MIAVSPTASSPIAHDGSRTTLIDRGLGCHTERGELAGWESGQDHLALYLYNCNEYIEGMLGAYKARVAPFNVNYRYVEEELLYLLNDSSARAIVYHSAFAPTLEAVRAGSADARGAPPGTGRLRATTCLPDAVLVRRRARVCARQPAERDAVARRSVHPLHGRHHRHAEGRAVAPGRHLPRRARRA